MAKRSENRRPNVAQGFWRDGRFHPIRASKDYNEFLGGDFEKRSRRRQHWQLSLSQFVRRAGGIRPDSDGANKGELARLSRKELGTTGLVRKSSGRSADHMREIASEAGYDVSDTSDAFINDVEEDARGIRRIMHPEWYEHEAWHMQMRRNGSKEKLYFVEIKSKAGELLGEGAVTAANREHGLKLVRRGYRQAGDNPNKYKIILKLANGRGRRPAPALPLFESPNVRRGASGRRVQIIDDPRYKGKVLGETDEWLKVKWDDGYKSALVRKDIVTFLNPSKSAEKKQNGIIGSAARAVGNKIKRGRAVRRATREFKKELKSEGKMLRARGRKSAAARAARELYANPFDHDRRRRNPAAPEQVQELYREFLGREPNGKNFGVYLPTGSPADVSFIGPLEEIGLDDGRILRINGASLGQAEVAGRRRCYVGLKQPFRSVNGGAITREINYGPAEYVDYWAAKPHLENDNKVRCYRHAWGDEGGRRPSVVLTTDGRVKLRGGDYTTEARGIRN